MGLSISHSGAFAVAVAAPFLVGVDLETDDVRPEALAKYFLSDYERLSVANLETAEKNTAVNRLWTRKEAACKVGGWGGTLAFSQLDCSGPMTTVQGRRLGLATDSLAGYVASLAYERHATNFDSRNATSHVQSVRFHG
jgi:phosphopantetheinyl transferase